MGIFSVNKLNAAGEGREGEIIAITKVYIARSI